MGQRRNRTVDLEMESKPSSQPEPSSIPLGSAPQQPDDDDDDHIPASPYFPNLESLSLEEPPYDNSAVFYGLPQYHHHPHHHDPTNFYVPYVTFLPPPIQIPSPVYERNAHFMDHTRGAYKRKNTEGIPLTTLAAPYHTSETVAPFGSLRNRPGAAVTMNLDFPPYAPNSFIQVNYAGHHPFPPPGSILYDPSFWPHTHYMHGGNIGNPTAFMYPSHLNPRDHYHHHHHHPAPLPVQGVRGQSATLYPHMASSVSYRVPFGSFAPQNAMNSGPSSSEMNLVQPTEFRRYEHHQGDDSVHVATLREHRGGVPRLTLMPDDEVAMLEFGDFGSGNSLTIDQHRDMRLDIEGMSYEEISALTERIGTVNTGLPEEDVKNHLKTRTWSGMNHEEEESSSLKTKETESCTICQESFKNEEKIGTLDCGHEYHAECLEKWLIVKNICPICKSEALVMEKKKKD